MKYTKVMKRIIRSILVALFTPIILLLILVLLGTMCLILLIEKTIKYAFKTEKEESDGQIFCLKLEQSSCISSKPSTVKLFTIKIP